MAKNRKTKKSIIPDGRNPHGETPQSARANGKSGKGTKKPLPTDKPYSSVNGFPIIGTAASPLPADVQIGSDGERPRRMAAVVQDSLQEHANQNRKAKDSGVAAERIGSLEKFRRMATVIQDSNDAITIQDLDGNILAWNRGAELMYGYSEAEALNMNIVDTVPAEYQEEARGFLASLKRGELVPNLETKRKHKDGRIIDVWLTNTKLTDDKGKLTGIATTERDITEQTKTLEKFRRMATVIKDSNDAITFQDLDGNILAWNRGAELMYGYSEAEALSKNIVDTVPTEYQEEARGFLASLKRGELVPNLETKRKHKDGRIIDVWLTNTKLTDDKGKLTGIATTERDITERMGSLEKFRRMATVIQDSNDAITFQDLEGNILAWNQGAEVIYGYSQAEALGMNIVDTVPKEYQEEAREFLSSLKRGELVPTLETKRKTKDGRIVDVGLTNTKLTDDKGKLTGIATTERDITEQTKTLEKFRRMATVIQDSNDAITFQDLDGNILAWNRGAEQIYGYSETEALGMNIVDTVPTEYQEEAREFLSSLKRGKLVPSLETKRKTKDGRIVDVWLTNTKLTDDKGKLTGIATTERDITERMGSLEKFRRMATVIQDSNDAITFQDLEGNILAWNQGAEVIYGYSQAEALGMNIVDTVPTEYQEEARGFLASLKRGELLPNLETKRKHKDGRIIDVWMTNTKLTDDKGKLTGIATTERDITERKHSEASLREKARELEFLREGQITLSNKMRGEQDVSRLGQSVLSHLAPFLNAQMGAFYCITEEKTFKRVSGYAYAKLEDKEETIALGEGLVGQTALEKRLILLENVPAEHFGKIRSALGGSTPRSLILAPVFYEGEVNGVIELASYASFSEHQKTFLEHVSENIGIAINTSISRKKQQEILEVSQILTEKLQTQQGELKHANEQLEVRSDEVQRASQYKSEFLANMSHELRTPLNSSLILAKLLADNARGNLTEEQIQYAVSIHSAGNDLLSLINDILDLSKVEAGKLEMRLESVFLPKVLESLEKTFDPLAKEKKLKFQIKTDPGVAETMSTDRQRLEQILKNLLSNAFKFTEKGEVTLHTSRRSDGRLAFSVIDTGIGVAKAQQEVIFEAFRQADGTTNRKYGGTGLGLSISRDLARLLGGTVEVESVPGEGSRFTLILSENYDESRIEAASPKSYSSSTAASGSTSSLEMVKRVERVKPAPFSDDRGVLAKPGRTLLVIEDDPQFAQILFDLAHELHYKCVVAQDAEEGLTLAKSLLPDAISLDLNLPDRSGLSVLDQLKEDPKTRHIPVHIASVHDYIEKTLQMGAIGYVLKPAERDKLKAAFAKIDSKLSQKIKRVLIVEDDKLQRESIVKLISDIDVEITAVALASEALDALKKTVYDCMVIDLKLPDMPGEQLLKEMTEQKELASFPPVIVYTGLLLSRAEEDQLRKYSRSVIIKGANSPERLLDGVCLFLHCPDYKLSPERRRMQKTVGSHEDVFGGKKILIVDDDARNIFALTAALETKGANIVAAINGKDALTKLDEDPLIDLVLMDIMMAEMDGFQTTREIRKQKRFERLPIIAVTAKATKNDQVLCKEAGMDDYVAKPIDLHQLFSLVRVWMPQLGRD